MIQREHGKIVFYQQRRTFDPRTGRRRVVDVPCIRFGNVILEGRGNGIWAWRADHPLPGKPDNKAMYWFREDRTGWNIWREDAFLAKVPPQDSLNDAVLAAKDSHGRWTEAQAQTRRLRETRGERMASVAG